MDIRTVNTTRAAMAAGEEAEKRAERLTGELIAQMLERLQDTTGGDPFALCKLIEQMVATAQSTPGGAVELLSARNSAGRPTAVLGAGPSEPNASPTAEERDMLARLRRLGGGNNSRLEGILSSFELLAALPHSQQTFLASLADQFRGGHEAVTPGGRLQSVTNLEEQLTEVGDCIDAIATAATGSVHVGRETRPQQRDRVLGTFRELRRNQQHLEALTHDLNVLARSADIEAFAVTTNIRDWTQNLAQALQGLGGAQALETIAQAAGVDTSGLRDDQVLPALEQRVGELMANPGRTSSRWGGATRRQPRS